MTREVAAEVTGAGFREPEFFGDVAGAGFDASAPTFSVVARRP